MILTPMTLNLGSNPEEGMGVCKFILPLLHGGTYSKWPSSSKFPYEVGRRERGMERGLTTSRVFFLKIWVEPIQIVLSPV
ncbi:hypothetical protein TNCV_993031 [Trichonephila clavipes]|nr:hypothetical protein TNCV_993031 [Trichonephila clavipes]